LRGCGPSKNPYRGACGGAVNGNSTEETVPRTTPPRCSRRPAYSPVPQCVCSRSRGAKAGRARLAFHLFPFAQWGMAAHVLLIPDGLESCVNLSRRSREIKGRGRDGQKRPPWDLLLHRRRARKRSSSPTVMQGLSTAIPPPRAVDVRLRRPGVARGRFKVPCENPLWGVCPGRGTGT